MKDIAETELKEEDGEINLAKLQLNIKQLNDKSNGKHGNIWKLKNRFSPKIKPSIPIAKMNLANKIITNPVELKKVYVKHFQHRMRTRPILDKYKSYESAIQNRFSDILNFTNENKYPDWSMQNLEDVLKSLKRSQSPDSMGLVNELFMLENIGTDLKISLLQLFNKI